ncbi:MAG: hypothetical protein H0T46_34510 [Deltaproteobacteria bacterium]|nr:hypothetical protein [Deltaproteobacteria bacterium]
MTCTKCGAAVLPTGICSSCGHNAHVDLEIAAFMTPHINRARIVLVAVGLLYAFLGWRAYGDIVEVKQILDAYGEDTDYSELRSAVTLAYAIVVYVMVAGVANIILAIIAGKKTLLAFNIAGAIFLIHTALQMWAAGALFITSWVWWVTAIALAMGYTAAQKAERLRRGTPPGPSATF